MGPPACRLIVTVNSSPSTEVSVPSVETPETPWRFADCVTLPKAGSDAAARVAALRVESGSPLWTSAVVTAGISGVVDSGMEAIGLPPPPPQAARTRTAATAARLLVFMGNTPCGISTWRVPGRYDFSQKCRIRRSRARRCGRCSRRSGPSWWPIAAPPGPAVPAATAGDHPDARGPAASPRRCHVWTPPVLQGEN